MTTLRTAAQAALEALEGWDNYGKWVWPESALEQAKRNTAESLASLRAALAEPVQEPVAWVCPEDPERETAFSWKAGHCENCGKQRIPLYTAPPQRKPLTDAEIDKLFGAVADVPRAHWLRQAAIEVVRKTEAAHGIEEEE